MAGSVDTLPAIYFSWIQFKTTLWERGEAPVSVHASKWASTASNPKR